MRELSRNLAFAVNKMLRLIEVKSTIPILDVPSSIDLLALFRWVPSLSPLRSSICLPPGSSSPLLVFLMGSEQPASFLAETLLMF